MMSAYEFKKINDFCKTGSGGTPSRSKSEYFINGSIPWVKSGELKGRFVNIIEEYITEEAIKNSSAKIVPENALLIAMYGATVGEVSQLKFDAATNQAICNIIPDPSICDVNYLYRFLEAIKPELLARRVGGGQPNISQSIIKETLVPLPPLPEQRRIAAILDKADELRQKRRQAIEKLDQLLQATFIDLFGDPVSNPKGWGKSTIKRVLSKLTDGTHHSPPLTSTGIPYITAKHIKLGYVNFDSAPTYISTEDHNSIYARCDPTYGDVLYIKDGATTGIAAINRFRHEFSLLSSVALLRPNRSLITEGYLESWLNNNLVKQSILLNMGGAAIKRLTLAKIKELPINVPPLELQYKFDQIKSEILKQRAKLQESDLLIDHGFSSLQQRAFSGNL